MRTPKAFIIFIASIALIKCADSNITEVMPNDNWKLISFEELSVNSVPPCLDYTSVNFEIVMKDYQDYEDYRRRYAPQGEYVYYDAERISE